MAKKLEDLAKKNSEITAKNTKNKIYTLDDMPTAEDLRYVEMPEWWVKGTNTKGIPFGKIVMIAGDSDSGKTSCSIAAMKAAQEQNVSVFYCETEGKTTRADLTNWGITNKNFFFTSSSVAEEIYDLVCDFLMSRDSSEPFLVVLDSIGNVISRHDAERSMADSSSKPGGKGKTNREGLNKLIAMRTQRDIALLVINYTYDNIGSPGKTNAGGKAVNFFSSLTYQTSRKAWIEKTEKGEKKRIGAKVTWKLFKNHLNRNAPGPKSIEIDITADGMKLAGSSNDE